MLLTEHEGKLLLARQGVAVPPGALVTRPAQVARLRMTYPVAVKAQVAAGSRGKQGGVKRCGDAAAAAAAAAEMLAGRFGGERPRGVLIEPWLEAKQRELYVAVTVDGRAGGYVVLYAATGGVDIEAGAPPLRHEIGPASAFRGHALRAALAGAEADPAVRERVVALVRAMLFLAVASDCTTVEINPVLVMPDGSLIAGDAKVVRDDAAAFRQSDIELGIAKEQARQPSDIRRCQKAGLMLLWLDGDVGLISTGAGMTMAAMDAIAALGGKPACFLDCSGNPTPAGFGLAFELLDRAPQVRAILVSIFGGGMQMDRVARTMAKILPARRSRKPVVFRLNGTRADEASAILAELGIANHATLEQAVAAVLQPAPKAAA